MHEKTFAMGFGICLALSLTSCLPSCNGEWSKKVDFEKDSTFHGFEKADVKSWDPATAYDVVSLDLVPSIYETLYQYAYLSEVYRLEPLLASAMPTYSADQKTLTIPIRPNTLFQDDPCFDASGGDGRELTAHDFVYGMKRLALPALKSSGWWILDSKIVGINAFRKKLANASQAELPTVFEEEVEGLKALDNYTLQLKLTKADPRFIYLLAMSFSSPVAKEAVKKYGDRQGGIPDHPVGTGPFVLTKWARNQKVVLDSNPNYRLDMFPPMRSSSIQNIGLGEDAGKRIPFLDRIVVSIMQEPEQQWSSFMKGNHDLILLPKDNFKQAITNKVNLAPELVQRGIRLNIETGVIIRFLNFNMKDKLLGSNKYLRQALSSAIDRDKWIKLFTNNTANKMVNSVPPGIVDRPSNRKIKYGFNLTRAKDLLKKAGYPDGQGLPEIKFELRGSSVTDRELGEFFSQQFAKIGVKLEVVPNTFPAFLEKVKEGSFQMALGSWTMDYPDVENIYELFYGPSSAPGPNDSSYDSPTFNNLYVKMDGLESGPKRAQLVQKMEDLIQEDCPWALGYYESSYNLSQPWFLNFRSSDIILNKYKYFRIDREIKKRYLNALYK